MSSPQSTSPIYKAIEPVHMEQAARSGLFRNVSRETLDRLSDIGRIMVLPAGQTLMAPGQANERLYLVLQGKLRIYLSSPDLPHYLTLASGECVGELSLIDGREASAMVVAVTDSELLEIEQAGLWSLVYSCHDVARNLLYILSGRVRKDNDAINGVMQERLHLEQVANVDGLTGIHNRRWLDDVFPRAIDRSRRDARPLSLIVADIDYFKRYNDDHGHLAGDRVLCHVARILSDNLRPTDMLARYGGEEFAILLPDTDACSAVIAAERIRRALTTTELCSTDGVSLLPGITLSMGVAGMQEADSLAPLLMRADEAMYRAKAEGRDRVVCHCN